MLIGICGKARSGKDTLARQFMRRIPRLEKYSFADPIKDVGDLLFGWNYRHREGELKEVVDPNLGFSPRKFYQLLGTEFGRQMLRQDIWIVLAQLRYEDIQERDVSMIIPDVRFDNEADFILRNKGHLIYVTRPDVENGLSREAKGHASENSLDYDLANHVIQNVGTLEDYTNEIDRLAIHFMELHK